MTSSTSLSGSRHRLRLVCVNDVYTFKAVDGHGGWARAATLMRDLKNETTAQKDIDALTFVNGDVMGGSSLLQHSKGKLAIEIMNAIPIDGCVLGNHEFDYGPKALRECLAASRFDWLGSNVLRSDTSQLLDGVQDYQVRTLDCGIKVGIFGVCTRATPQLSNPTDAISFIDVEETARRVVAHLRNVEGVHVVVALTHLAAAQDRTLMESVPDIDVVLGGHDHEPLALEHHHSLLFKCGQNGYWVGVVDLDLEYAVEGEKSIKNVQMFPSWSMHSTCRVRDDAGIQEIVNRYQEEVDREVLLSHGDALKGMDLDDVVATIAGEALDTRTAQVRRQETNSGNLIADAMLDYYDATGFTEETPDKEIDIMAFINGGFIRGDRRYPAGTRLRLRDILEEMPFPKTANLLEIQGSHLHRAMEQQLCACPAASGGFPHLSSNAHISYDVSAPPLSRIKRFTINGRDLQDERKYLIVVTDFVASGGDSASQWCFGVHQAVPNRPTQRISIIVLNYLRKRQIVDIGIEGRVSCIQ